MFQSPGWSCQSSILFKHHLAVDRGGSFGVAQEPVQITVLEHLDMDYRMRSVSSWVSGQTISWVWEGHPNPGGIPHSRQAKNDVPSANQGTQQAVVYLAIGFTD